MGAACCVSAKDKTLSSGSHARNSPTWSFRWDNRVREAEEESENGGNSLRNPSLSGNVRMGSQSSDDNNTTKAAFGSENKESPFKDSSQKSTASESTSGIRRIPSRGAASLRNITHVKEPTGSSSVSCPSPLKPSPLASSPSSSSLSSQSHPLNSDPRFHHHHYHRPPPHGLILQASDYSNNNTNQAPDHKSPPSSGNESMMSFDTGSILGFSDFTNLRIGERWSFDSEASGLIHDKISLRSSGPLSLHSCGICSKHQNERPPWGLISSSGGLSVVSVLTCGHVYHAECLEFMTPEVNKYDPSCPVCVFGEKTIAKMSEKALKSRKKKPSKCVVVDSDFSDNSSDYYTSGGRGLEEKRGSTPFLRRHFSFGSKQSSSSSKKPSPVKKQGFFWARSSKY